MLGDNWLHELLGLHGYIGQRHEALMQLMQRCNYVTVLARLFGCQKPMPKNSVPQAFSPRMKPIL